MTPEHDYDDQTYTNTPEETDIGKAPMEQRSIPKKLIGQMRLKKGKIDGTVQIITWDSVPFCLGDVCGLMQQCGYEPDTSKRCGVMMEYMRSFDSMIYRNFQERMTEPFLYRLGMHLTPLYMSLCKHKMQEAQLNFQTAYMEDDKGNVKCHPVYDKLTKTIAQIEKQWFLLGINRDNFVNGDELDGNSIHEMFADR